MKKNSIFALLVIGANLIGSAFSPIFPNWDLFSGSPQTSIEIIMWKVNSSKPVLLSERKTVLNPIGRRILQLAKGWLEDLNQKPNTPAPAILFKLLNEHYPNCQKVEIAHILFPVEKYLFLNTEQKIAHLSVIGSINGFN